MLLNAYLFTLSSVCVLGSQPGASNWGPKGTKAGISWPAQEGSSDPVNKFFPRGSKISWSYNWGKTYNTGLLDQTSKGFKLMGEFAPMFFTDHDANEFPLQESYSHILGFNEPDASSSAVANSVEAGAAVTAWNQFAHLRGDNVKLVSPAMASDDLTWLRNFWNAVEVKPDYVAVHAYALDVQTVKDKINKYHDEFKVNVWVTEVAMTTFGGAAPPSQQAVHDFMGQITKWMDETPWIERYAWFGALRNPEHLHAVHPFNRLMDEKGEVTPLGWQYVWGGHH